VSELWITIIMLRNKGSFGYHRSRPEPFLACHFFSILNSAGTIAGLPYQAGNSITERRLNGKCRDGGKVLSTRRQTKGSEGQMEWVMGGRISRMKGKQEKKKGRV
jgi:hypothetical protein